MSKITDLYEEMEIANKAANFHLEELERNTTRRNIELSKEAIDQHRRAIEEFEAALAERRFIRSIYFISSLLAFILGVITYQYVKR
jgi:hypothetical protein